MHRHKTGQNDITVTWNKKAELYCNGWKPGGKRNSRVKGEKSTVPYQMLTCHWIKKTVKGESFLHPTSFSLIAGNERWREEKVSSFKDILQAEVQLFVECTFSTALKANSKEFDIYFYRNK